jgi:hypothetical protein
MALAIPTWIPHPLAEERRKSAIAFAKAILAIQNDLIEAHFNEGLKIAIWKYSEHDCRTKHQTRFQTQGVLNAPKSKKNHEHVIPIKTIRAQIIGQPHAVAQILSTVVACTVLVEEHAALMAAERANPELSGWDRYRAAGLCVYDLQTQKQFI